MSLEEELAAIVARADPRARQDGADVVIAGRRLRFSAEIRNGPSHASIRFEVAADGVPAPALTTRFAGTGQPLDKRVGDAIHAWRALVPAPVLAAHADPADPADGCELFACPPALAGALRAAAGRLPPGLHGIWVIRTPDRTLVELDGLPDPTLSEAVGACPGPAYGQQRHYVVARIAPAP